MALRDVNLVPAATLQRRLLRRHAIVWAAGYSVIVAVLFSGFLAYAQRVIPQGYVSNSGKQLQQQLSDTIARIEAKQAQIDGLAFVRRVSRPFGSAEMLTHLARIMDPETWVTQLSVEADKDAELRLVLQGYAFSNARLGATIQALTADSHFKDVVLKYSSSMKWAPREAEKQADIVQFGIEARIVTEQ